MGSRGDVGGVTGDMAAVQVSIAAFWEWHHLIFIRRHQDILQLCLWRPKPDVFHKKSGHHQLCVCYRNLAFSRRPRDTSIRICWDHKRIFLSWEVGPSPVVFVATQLGVFKGCLATFPAAFVETKSGIFFMGSRAISSFVYGERTGCFEGDLWTFSSRVWGDKNSTFFTESWAIFSRVSEDGILSQIMMFTKS